MHLKSTIEIHCHKGCVYYFFVNKDGRQLEEALCVDNSKFFLHAAYEELNLIQILTYIHPLQMMIKTLRAQMGSQTLMMKLHLQVRLTNHFPVTLAASASLYQCQVSIVVRKKHRANILQTICKTHVSGSVSMHS